MSTVLSWVLIGFVIIDLLALITLLIIRGIKNKRSKLNGTDNK